MLIDIDLIVVSDRIRRDYGDLKELAEDIRVNTLLNPPVVNTKNPDGTYTLIAGERRIRAMRDVLGYSQVDVRVVPAEDDEHALLMEISENECRKEFTKTERLDYARRLARIESAKAKERQGTRTDMVENSPLSQDAGKTRDKVAATLGTSSNTIAREQFIESNRALLDPADFADWDEGRLSTNKAYQRIKAAQAEAIRERDAARRELEDAYRAGEAMEAEAASLRRQLAERPKPEVEVREVEVVPEDYAEMKRQIEHLKYDNALNSKDNQGLRRSIEEKNDEIDRLKVLVDGKYHKDNASWDIRVLTTATNSYLSQYGGKLWAFDQFDHADEVTREEFVKAMTSLAAFSQNLLEMLREKGN